MGKVTIVKILPHGDEYSPSPEDLDRWRKLFAEDKITLEEAAAAGDLEYQVLPQPQENEYYLTLVRVGSDHYYPTVDDLESWRKVFLDAKDDPDFKIFTHPDVDVSVINIGKIIAAETEFDHLSFEKGNF